MKNQLIIGASSGIGNAIYQNLSQKGHNVYGTYNTTQLSASSSAQTFQFDVLNDTLNVDLLPESLDGLTYCPGSINLKPFNRITPQSFVDDFKLQVEGAIKVIQAVLPKLKKSGNASVVLFSTVAVHSGYNFHSQVSVSKGAIEGLTKALAAEFAPLIRVNCVAPSLTDTPLAAKLLNSEAKLEANAARHPLKRIGTAQDISNMACFLLNEESAWVTGQVLHVDGGMSSVKL